MKKILKNLNIKRAFLYKKTIFGLSGIVLLSAAGCSSFLEKDPTFIVKENYYTNENDVNSTYFLAEGSSDPVIVFVPGVKGDLSELASLQEQDWRSRVLFNSSPRSLQKVSVSFPGAPSENFTIVSKGNKFEVENLPAQDSSKIHRYLMLYGVTNVDKYIVNGKDTIVNQLHKGKPF